jgi:hypothetical protein
MGFRGIIRDILGIYLGYEILKGALSGSFELHIWIIFSAVVMLIFGIWFILERIGILPKFGE